MAITQESAERLGAEITELCSYIYAAEHRLLTLIREFDEQEGWSWLGFQSCAHWLNHKCGIDLNTARERVRVAHALGRLAKIDAKFAKGAVSYSKVRAMTRIADESNEDYLLEIAKFGTAYHVEKLVSKFRRAEHLMNVDTARKQRDCRGLDYHYDDDGCLVIKGRFPAEQGALIVKALEMAMERQIEVEREPVSVRRADALAEVAETYMNSEPVPNSTADRYQVVIHTTDDIMGAASAATDVSAETSRRITCDSSILRVRDNGGGEPMSIGRKTRAIPPAMRRALRLRDGGCRFPGCTNDRFVDGHHIKHWADGGETSLDNLILLCRHHHHLVHEGGFSCKKTRDGEVVFEDQREAILPRWSALPAIGDQDIHAWLGAQFLQHDIDADTCTARYNAGERMDWDLAVGHLFS